MNRNRILVVDDNKANIRIIEVILKKAGYDVITAGSGFEALKIAASEQPDLILLDIKMPGMDGFETCSHFKSSETMNHIPIIFLTAETEIKSMAKGFQLGAVDYLTKPFNSVELRTRIKTQLDILRSSEIISKKNREQKELLHILCHDLKNPFANLQTLFELYEKKPGLLNELLSPMQTSIRNGLETIEIVRKMRAVDEEKYEIQLKTENLHQVVLEAVSIIKQIIVDKKINLEILVDEEHFVEIEKTTFINSVLNNLLTNAIKFSYSNAKIEIKSKTLKDSIELSVKDFGVGMSSKVLGEIFDVSKSTSMPGTEGETGTGFGMPLVKKFVVAYGGTIKVISQKEDEDTENHGTEVILTLRSNN